MRSTERALFSIPTPLSRSLEPCCDSDHVLSCVDVDVNPEVLLNDHDISINNVTLVFSNLVPPHARVYKTEAGDEAVISYNPHSGNIIGTLHTSDGHVFALEKCGSSYIFEEFDVASFPEDMAVDGADIVGDLTPPAANTTMRQGQKTFSVMFYYTPEFAAVTPNIEDFIDQIVAETNQGYVNSGLDITMTKFCHEETSLTEESMHAHENGILRAFTDMKGAQNFAALRNTADAAHLLSVRLKVCGMAYLAGYRWGNTLGVTMKGCALGNYVVGHEVGHNFGAQHDKDTHVNPYYDYGHGHLIEDGPGFNLQGYRTIMAYSDGHHTWRVNYYSNPDIILPETGTPTGVAGISNNVRVFRENIDALAALGDESATCTPPAPTTAAPPSCATPGYIPISAPSIPAATLKLDTWEECHEHCQDTPGCVAWSYSWNNWCTPKTGTQGVVNDTVGNGLWGLASCGLVPPSCATPGYIPISAPTIPDTTEKLDTWEECHLHCQDTPGCVAWSYSWTGTCRPKTGTQGVENTTVGNGFWGLASCGANPTTITTSVPTSTISVTTMTTTTTITTSTTTTTTTARTTTITEATTPISTTASTTTTEATTTTTAAPTSCAKPGYLCSGNNAAPAKKRKSWKKCRKLCRKTEGCAGWSYSGLTRWCYLKSSADCSEECHQCNWQWGSPDCKGK